MNDSIAALKGKLSKLIRSGLNSDEAFEQAALSIFSYQFENNHPYRQFCIAKKRTPFTVRHWSEIPAVPITAFKETLLSTISINQAQAVFMTSGTTKPEQRGKNLHLDLEIYDLSMKWGFRYAMLPDRERMCMAVLFPDEQTLPNSSLAHYLTLARREFGQPGSICAFDGEVFQPERLISFLRNAEDTQTPVFFY